MEFRYKRECLREMGVEEAYAFLDQLPCLWAYSTKQWLRHTIPTTDRNKARWPTSPLWEAGAAGDVLRRWRASGAGAQDGGRSAPDLPDARWVLDHRQRPAHQCAAAPGRWDALPHLVHELAGRATSSRRASPTRTSPRPSASSWASLSSRQRLEDKDSKWTKHEVFKT